MKRAGVVIAVTLTAFAQAWAQDMGDAPSTTQTDSANVQMVAPGGGPNININVQMQQMNGAPATPQPAMFPAPAPGPAPVAYRDCGVGEDPGCVMSRRGHLPMDADEFSGFLQALRSNPNELERQDMVKATLQDGFITAKQLGRVLDLFQNEITRYEVAEVAAPKVVNPRHALKLASTFQNGIYASDFTKLMTSQRD